MSLPAESGIITYEGGQYRGEFTNPEAPVKATLTLFDLPSGYVFLFSKDWQTNAFLSHRYPCKAFIGTNENDFKLTVFIDPTKDGSDANLAFAVTAKTAQRCNDITPRYRINLPFYSETTDQELDTENTSGEVIADSEPSTEPESAETSNSGDSGDSEVLDISAEGTESTVDTPAANPLETETQSTVADQVPEVKTPEKTAGQIAYEKAFATNKLEAYQQFVEEYPNAGSFSDSAKYHIARLSEIDPGYPNPVAGGYEIVLKMVLNPGIDSLPFGNAVLLDNPAEPYSRILRITGIPKGRNVQLRIYDPSKPENVNETIIPLGQHLEPTFVFNEDGSFIQQINFNKGTPPYKIYLVSKGVIRYTHTLKENENSWVIDPDFYKEKKLEGEIFFRISDKQQSVPFSNPEWKVTVTPDNSTAFWLIGVAFLLLVAVFIIPKIRQSQRERNQAKFKEERSNKWEDYKEKMMAKKDQLIANAKTVIEEGGNAFEEEQKAAITASGKSGIVIKKVKKATANIAQRFDEKILEKRLKSEFTFQFDTKTLWSDSQISEIIFTKTAIEDLDHFLKEQNLVPLREQEGQIPEIGGILLGKPFSGKGTADYRVLVEEFVPINPEYHDTYQLEFSAHSLAKDLGDIQDKYPDMILVGWFHTHPGHGLFLSRPDLRIHDSFFKESYQFAMEIDSISDRLDTGFFTRMHNGKVNNRRDRKADSNWFSWLDSEIN